MVGREYSKKIITTIAIVVSSLVMAPVANAAVPVSTSSSASTEITGYSQMKPSDWREIERRATAAGDISSARLASDLATGKQNSNSVTRGVAGWVKNAVKITLKYYKDRLPAPIRPHADKLYEVLNKLDKWTEGSIASGIMGMGMDPVTAQSTAHYMNLFISTFGPI